MPRPSWPYRGVAHLKAIFPFATLDDLYDGVWHRGVLSSGFFSSWMATVGIMAGVSDEKWHSTGLDLARRALDTQLVHGRMEHVNGAVAAKVLRQLRAHYDEEPFGRLWQQAAVEHPTHDAWWDERNLRAELGEIDIPVYLGCQWDNVPVRLPSSFPVFEALAHNPNVRLTLLDKGGLLWPWETMHEEALASVRPLAKGRDTGIMDGPPVRFVIPGTDEWRTAESWPPAESGYVGYALCADGTLAPEEGEPGIRSYLYLPADSGRPRNANPPTLPDRLSWRLRGGHRAARHRRRHRTRARCDHHRPGHRLDRGRVRPGSGRLGHPHHGGMAPRGAAHRRRGAQQARPADDPLLGTRRRPGRRRRPLPHPARAERPAHRPRTPTSNS